MKKTSTIILAIAALLFSAAALRAQSTFGNVVSVDKVVHDFGDIFTDQGAVSCSFTFTNISSKPILLLTAVSSCGCTEAEWTREPIQPGKTGKVSATFNNEDGPYPFDKTVTVYVSDLQNPIVLHIRGSAHQNARPLNESFNLKFGNFGVRSLEFKAGNLSQGESKSGNIVVANLGKTPLKVEFENVSEDLTLAVFPNPIPAKSIATLSYTIKASRDRWGKNWYYATPVVDGHVMRALGSLIDDDDSESDSFYSEKNDRLGLGKTEIGFWAVSKENFAGVPTNIKNQMSNPTFTKSTVSFGKLSAGSKTTLTFEYTNNGKQNCKFYKLDADCSNVTVKEMETAEPGKKGKIVVDLDTKGMPKGENIIALNLFSNSPFRPVISLQITGTIQ